MVTSERALADHQRGVQVQGEYLRYLRRSRGWTQQELARRAGYCDRLIRKAERNGFLLPETIEVLAETLSSSVSIVDPSTLWLLPRTKIDLLLRILRGEDLLVEKSIAAISKKSICIVCKGPDCIPFSGTYSGQRGFRRWIQRFRNSLADDQSIRGDQAILVDQERAFLHASWVFENDSRDSKLMDLNIRIDLSMGQIEKMVVICDTQDFIEFFQQDCKRTETPPFAKKARYKKQCLQP